MKEVRAYDLGLDSRAGHRLYVDNKHIIVDARQDRTLQYYGGFEYIKDSESRLEFGGYVIYKDDSRVTECLAQIDFSEGVPQ